MKACAYCGTPGPGLERDHVIPRCLYPASRAGSTVQRITVLSCGECNRGWSDDEAHFRNVLLVAGEPNQAVQELWDTTARRSFRLADGERRLKDIRGLLIPVEVDGARRWKIYPARDPRVLRVLRKIIRGLSHFHDVESALSEERVWVDVLKYQIPPEFEANLVFHHREPDVCEYWYESNDTDDISAFWLLRFFEKRMFIGMVSHGQRDAAG